VPLIDTAGLRLADAGTLNLGESIADGARFTSPTRS